MSGVSAGPEVQVKLPATPPARARMLRVEVNGLLHDWFDIDEMGQFVRSPTFSTTLRENIARYFGVPVKHQAIYDEDGLLTTSADFSRALQRFSPKLYIYDAHEMGEHLRERTSEQLAMIDAEVEQSRKNFLLTTKPRPSGTPRQRRPSRSEKHESSQAEGPHDGAPEVTPVKALQPEAAALSRPPDHGTAPAANGVHGTRTPTAPAALESGALSASASSVETMNIGPAPAQASEAMPGKAPVVVPVDRVVWPLEPALVQPCSGVCTPVSRAPDLTPTTSVCQEPAFVSRVSVVTPQATSLRAPSQGGNVVPRILRPSLSVRAPSASPGCSSAVPVVVTVSTPPQAPPLQCNTPATSSQRLTQRASVQAPALVAQGRGMAGQAAELGHATAQPIARSVSPQPVPAVVISRSATPVRVPSQVRLEQNAARQSPASTPPWHSPPGWPPQQQQQQQQQPQQQVRHAHVAPAPIHGAPSGPGVLQATYSPVATGAPGQVIQVPLTPQRRAQLPPQQFSMPTTIAAPEGALCRDGSPTREFVESAGRFFGFVDHLQKRGCRKPRIGSREGMRDVRMMQQAAQQGRFEGEVENIWE